MSVQSIVVVMGPTGSGKSSFVRLITGNEQVIVGDGLKSTTTAVTPWHTEFGGKNFTIVDTPGFDNAFISDRDVLESISKWLSASYRTGSKISAILYLHRISDPRMQGSALRNLHIFRDICGDDYCKHITFCITFWDVYQSQPEIADARWKELSHPDFFGGMIEKGSSICQRPTSQERALILISKLTKGQRTVALKIQEEVVEQNKTLETGVAALNELDLESKKQADEHARQMQETRERLQQEMRRKEKEMDEMLRASRQAFEEEQRRQEKEIARAKAEIDRRTAEYIKQKSTLQNVAEQLYQPPAYTTIDPQPTTHVENRQEKVSRFYRAVSSSLDILRAGQLNGHVKCNMLPVKPYYSAVCNNCFMTIGTAEYYECGSCTLSSTGAFILCQRCFTLLPIACKNPQHNKQSMIKQSSVHLPAPCPRAVAPPQGRRLLCTQCMRNVGICYLHCCACKHTWDLCVNCAIRGQHCPGHGRTFRTPHHVQVCFRYLE